MSALRPDQQPIEPTALVRLWHDAAHKYASEDPAAAKVLAHCAAELQAWIQHEGVHALMCMPRSYHRLICAAHAYNPNDGDMTDLEELVEAAIDCQTGPS